MKRLVLVLMAVAAGTVLSGCRFAAPALESVGGTGACGPYDCLSKTELILRHQGRLARQNEVFIDQYFFNYDIHDPYRADYYVVDGDCVCR